jgi:hypothetical protein
VAQWRQWTGEFAASDEVIAIRPGTLQAGLGHALSRWATAAERADQVVDVATFEPASLWPGLEADAAAALAAEVLPVVHGFAAAVAAKRVRVAFGPVRTTQCPKWHMDYMRMRLLRTYVGPGTEWVSPADVDPEAARHRPDCGCERSLLRPGAAIQHAATADWLLLKGRLDGEGRPGAVHRSPALAANAPPRVVLVVNTVG